MKQGDLYLVTLDPVVGSEQAKTCPCLIVSTDLVNDYASTVTIVPLSSQIRKKPFVFHIPFKDGILKLEQIRTVDKKRLVKRIGNIPLKTQNYVKNLLKLYFDIV